MALCASNAKWIRCTGYIKKHDSLMKHLGRSHDSLMKHMGRSHNKLFSKAVCCYEHVAIKSTKSDVVSQCTKSEMPSLQVLLLEAVLVVYLVIVVLA